MSNSTAVGDLLLEANSSKVEFKVLFRKEPTIMAKKKIISINRAPVLTLWAAIVARRLGFNKKEALTLGKTVAGVSVHFAGTYGRIASGLTEG